ncbi:MAG TPA: twin-arginine translocase TatA/TatE family subunit [Vicinamibacterales bacterium]|nr:twin-arginine translocase TatA/TatE family subunit [Vicinamibacterales bacterium]
MSLQYALFGPIGMPEMLIILVIIMLIFGASRLPEIGKGIGQGIKNFKGSIKETDSETKNS